MRNYFATRSGRHLFLGRYDGLQANLPLLPSPFSKEKVSRSPSTTTSQVLQIFRWLIATLNNVSNIQPKTPQGAAIPSPMQMRGAHQFGAGHGHGWFHLQAVRIEHC